MRTFIEEWRTAIDSESKSSGTKRLILTMGAYYHHVDSMSYPVDTIVRNFDWVHLITYDYYLPTKDNFTGAHTALYGHASKLNTDYAFKAALDEEEEDQRDSNQRLLAILLPTLTITILLLSTILCILKRKTTRSEGVSNYVLVLGGHEIRESEA
ncbi:hypothetical protein HAX54_014010 [Datura stramonium]|uniref:GH18 domain-containing protein n=1 Tax=Datura stramonium TaxID=4076 RepID=A0ABS8Y207_DATST|nr:hypothetical protein [Datura stramonium]